jgi:RNA polymerase sigma factor (sigma-70 family)
MPSRTPSPGGPALPFDSSTSSSDVSSLKALLVGCLPALRRLAHNRLPRWLRSIADTGDVVHDVVLRSLARLRSIDRADEGALGAYLAEAVRNRIRDEHRRVMRRGLGDALSDEIRDRGPSPFDLAAREQIEARYRAALARLEPLDQMLIVGHIELEFSHDQLGLMTGRSRNAARMALSRAVRRLAEHMREH